MLFRSAAQVKEEEQLIHVVMEYGEIDLAHLLHKQRKDGLNEAFVCMHWQQMLQAVHAIHEARVIHGDLKPANFLSVRGKLKLIDFGIAKEKDSNTTNINRDSTVGTLNYMSPEAITNEGEGDEQLHKLGRASDVWSLGCILYQMAMLKPPFEGGNPLVVARTIVEGTYAPLSGSYTPLMHQVVGRMLCVVPEQRPDIDEVAQSISPLLLSRCPSTTLRDCSGHGVCDAGRCRCDRGFAGGACSVGASFGAEAAIAGGG